MAASLDMLTNAGLPVPSIYDQESGSADQAYQRALASIAQQQASAFQNYGFKGQVDPASGALQDVRIDPDQQYSSVMNLLNSHAGNLRQLRDNLAGQGLAGGGGKGLAAQRAALLQFQQAGQTAKLGSQFAGVIGGLQNQQSDALNTRNQGYNQAATDAINFAIQNGWFNPAPAVAPNAGAAPSGGGGGSDPNASAPVSNFDPTGVVAPSFLSAMQNAASVKPAANTNLAALTPNLGNTLKLPNTVSGSGIVGLPNTVSGTGTTATAKNPYGTQAARNSF